MVFYVYIHIFFLILSLLGFVVTVHGPNLVPRHGLPTVPPGPIDRLSPLEMAQRRKVHFHHSGSDFSRHSLPHHLLHQCPSHLLAWAIVSQILISATVFLKK